jgi:hypothetical protein
MLVSVFLFTFAGLTAAAKPSISCLQNCEKQKKSCMDKYSKSDSRGVKSLTPEGQKVCWRSYHGCRKECSAG